jgi:hypothetical protein
MVRVRACAQEPFGDLRGAEIWSHTHTKTNLLPHSEAQYQSVLRFFRQFLASTTEWATGERLERHATEGRPAR